MSTIEHNDGGAFAFRLPSILRALLSVPWSRRPAAYDGSQVDPARRKLLRSAGIAPAACAAAVLAPAPLSAEEDAELFDALADLTVKQQREAAASARLDAAFQALNSATRPRPALPEGVNYLDLTPEMRERWVKILHDWNVMQREHPLYPEMEAAGAAWDKLNDSRRDAEEPFRRMPANTVAGVLAKLKDLQSDSSWVDGDIGDWVTEPIAQIVADLEQIAARQEGRA